MTIEYPSNSTIGERYFKLGATGLTGIGLIAGSLINPQYSVETDFRDQVAVIEKSSESYVANASGTGGIITGKYIETPLETLEKFVSNMVGNSTDSPREFEEIFRNNYMDLLA